MKPIKLITQLFVVLLLFGLEQQSKAQCPANTFKFPSADVIASAYNDTIEVTDKQNPGDFYVIKNLVVGQTYIFSSSVIDLITIRSFHDPSIVLAYGQSPLSYLISSTDIITVHINLVTPVCGTNSIFRTTKVNCTTCIPAQQPKVILSSNLEVSKRMTIGDANGIAEAGMIRWNAISNDFEGYDGSQWLSFTQVKSTWGNVVPSKIGLPNQTVSVSNPGGGNMYFGSSVAISGDYAVVGSPFPDSIGSAYVFKKINDTWVQQTKLLANDGAIEDYFGASVSIDGDYIVVGSNLDDISSNTNQGSAYVFHRVGSTWTQQAKLLASDGAIEDEFGNSVAIDGDYIVLGSYRDDISSNMDQGSAYVFHRVGSTWTQQAKLLASDGAIEDYFGSSVSIDGDYIVVGGPYDDISSIMDQGSAYVFHRVGSTWTQQAKLTNNDGKANDRFGFKVDIAGDFISICSSNFLENRVMHLFENNGNTWVVRKKFRANIFTAAISANTIIAGNYTYGAIYFINK